LLPVGLAVRRQAQQVQCASNLKQLGMAMKMYTQQYRFFPRMGLQVTDARPYAGNGVAWPALLRNMLKGNQKVFYCPAQDPRCQWTSDAPGPVAYAREFHTMFGYEVGERLLIDGEYSYEKGGLGTYFSYACNMEGFPLRVAGVPDLGGFGVGMGLFWWNPAHSPDSSGWMPVYHPQKDTDVRSASEFIIMGDTVADAALDFQLLPEEKMMTLRSGGVVSRAPARIHNGGANILFCDGHV